MRRAFATAAALAAAAMSTGTAAAAEGPVKITFDPSSSRADLVRGAKLPATVAAEPGSVRFHLLRFDAGEEVVYYQFDQLRSRLLERGAIAGDITPETVAERLRRALADRPRLALDDAAVLIARDWVVAARPDISACAAPLVFELASQLL